MSTQNRKYKKGQIFKARILIRKIDHHNYYWSLGGNKIEVPFSKEELISITVVDLSPQILAFLYQLRLKVKLKILWVSEDQNNHTPYAIGLPSDDDRTEEFALVSERNIDLAIVE